MKKNNTMISEIFLHSIALLQNVFGKYTDQMVYDQHRETAKKILYEVYGYRDIYKVLPPVVDMRKTIDVVRTLQAMTLQEEKKQ